MKEVFELLEYNGTMTVSELSDELNIELQLADNLLRHYNKNGYLTRSKNFQFKYSYQLSEKGIKQLTAFFNSNKYIEYLEIF